MTLPTGLTLEQDFVTVPGQRYALVSFVGPTLNQKNERLGMKIRGVFATEDEAKAHVKRIHDSGDQSVDIFLMEMNKWCVIPPDPKQIETQEYQEELLNNIMTQYAESQREARRLFEERRRVVKEHGIEAYDEGTKGPKIEEIEEIGTAADVMEAEDTWRKTGTDATDDKTD